jgi:hypothetical protein
MHNTGDNALHASLRTVLLPLIESFMEATD